MVPDGSKERIKKPAIYNIAQLANDASEKPSLDDNVSCNIPSLLHTFLAHYMLLYADNYNCVS